MGVLVKLLQRVSGGVEGRLRAEQLMEAAKQSIGVAEGKSAVRIKLCHLLDELEFYQSRLDKVELEMAGIMENLELGEILQSVKGIGPVISAVFLGEIGDVSRFDNWKQVRRLAGLNLVGQSSGQHKGRSKISRRGRPYLRYILFLAGQTCSRHNPELHAYYRCLRERNSNPLSGY